MIHVKTDEYKECGYKARYTNEINHQKLTKDVPGKFFLTYNTVCNLHKQKQGLEKQISDAINNQLLLAIFLAKSKSKRCHSWVDPSMLVCSEETLTREQRSNLWRE